MLQWMSSDENRKKCLLKLPVSLSIRMLNMLHSFLSPFVVQNSASKVCEILKVTAIPVASEFWLWRAGIHRKMIFVLEA